MRWNYSHSIFSVYSLSLRSPTLMDNSISQSNHIIFVLLSTWRVRCDKVEIEHRIIYTWTCNQTMKIRNSYWLLPQTRKLSGVQPSVGKKITINFGTTMCILATHTRTQKRPFNWQQWIIFDIQSNYFDSIQFSEICKPNDNLFGEYYKQRGMNNNNKWPKWFFLSIGNTICCCWCHSWYACVFVCVCVSFTPKVPMKMYA